MNTKVRECRRLRPPRKGWLALMPLLFLVLLMIIADYIGTFLVIGAVLGLNYRPAVKKKVRKME